MQGFTEVIYLDPSTMDEVMALITPEGHVLDAYVYRDSPLLNFDPEELETDERTREWVTGHRWRWQKGKNPLFTHVGRGQGANFINWIEALGYVTTTDESLAKRVVGALLGESEEMADYMDAAVSGEFRLWMNAYDHNQGFDWEARSPKGFSLGININVRYFQSGTRVAVHVNAYVKGVAGDKKNGHPFQFKAYTPLMTGEDGLAYISARIFAASKQVAALARRYSTEGSAFEFANDQIEDIITRAVMSGPEVDKFGVNKF